MAHKSRSRPGRGDPSGMDGLDFNFRKKNSLPNSQLLHRVWRVSECSFRVGPDLTFSLIRLGGFGGIICCPAEENGETVFWVETGRCTVRDDGIKTSPAGWKWRTASLTRADKSIANGFPAGSGWDISVEFRKFDQQTSSPFAVMR